MTITVTTANICGNPIRAKVAVLKRMEQALSRDGVVFGQEVAAYNKFRVPPRGNYSHAWHRIAAEHSKVTEGGGHEVPVSIPKTAILVSAESRFMHGGRKMVSPSRYATIVKTQIDGHNVAFVNCHTVSKPRRGVSAAAWRIMQYNLYLSKLADIVAELHTEGYTAIFGGDMNHAAPLPREFHADQHVLIERGLDHLWIVPAEGVQWAASNRITTPRTALMDHPILTVTVTLR